MIEKKLSPSLMCCDYLNLGKQLKQFEQSGIEYLHIDVMDGHFVPNISLGTDFIKAVRKNCSIPLDIHLMVENPENIIDNFDPQNGEYVSVHMESTRHPQRLIAKLKAKGIKTMVALNPCTPLSGLEYILDDIDGVMLMTVNPGYAGQKFIPSMYRKISDLRKFLDNAGRKDIDIEVDGNIGYANASEISHSGANIFVLGSSSIFSPELPLKDGIEKFRSLVK